MAVDPLDELKRLAYGRGVDAAAAATAQAELARLDAARAEAARRRAESERRETEPPAPPVAPAWTASRAAPRLLAGVALAALGALTLAVALPLVPARSVEVFDRAPSALDLPVPEDLLNHGVVPATVRWLAALDEVTAYGYLNASGYVCVGVVGPGGLSGSCTSRERFESIGIDLLATTGPVSGAVELRWGPRGEATLTSVPVSASG